MFFALAQNPHPMSKYSGLGGLGGVGRRRERKEGVRVRRGEERERGVAKGGKFFGYGKLGCGKGG